MSARPLLCTRCSAPVVVVEDGTACAVWGRAVIDDGGTVHPVDPEQVEFHKGDPVSRRAVCTAPTCRHQWTLRRRFDPTAHATEEPRP